MFELVPGPYGDCRGRVSIAPSTKGVDAALPHLPTISSRTVDQNPTGVVVPALAVEEVEEEDVVLLGGEHVHESDARDEVVHHPIGCADGDRCSEEPTEVVGVAQGPVQARALEEITLEVQHVSSGFGVELHRSMALGTYRGSSGGQTHTPLSR